MGELVNIDGCINCCLAEAFSLFFLTHYHKLYYYQTILIFYQYLLFLLAPVFVGLAENLSLGTATLLIILTKYQQNRTYMFIILCIIQNIRHISQMSQQQFPILTLFSILLTLSYGHYIPKIKGNTVDINTYINQAKQIQIPFKKCFQVDTELPANRKYITFEPSSLKLSEVRQVVISQNHQISVLEDLRSPRSNTHEHLIVFDDYALTFMPPNTMLVIEQDTEENYRVTNKIQIKQVNQYTQFKLYKFNNQAMMLLQSATTGPANNRQIGQNEKKIITKAFLISQKGYKQIRIDDLVSVSHFQGEGKEFFTAQYGEGVKCYSYSEENQQAILVANYSRKHFEHLSKNPYIIDINIKSLKTHKIIYALDGFMGVYRINLTQSLKQPKIQLVLTQSNCNAMDSMNADHLVLVCQLGTASYIVQAYAKQAESGEVIFEKLQPEYHVNYFNDLEINKNYFLVFSHRTLNVYWSSKENNIPETVNTRSQLDLPGLQTFYFKMGQNPKQKSYLYVIQSGVMKQMLMTESSAKLLVRSPSVLDKKFKISIFGNCQDLPKLALDQAQNRAQEEIAEFDYEALKTSTCQLQKTINMQVIEENSPRKEDFSVSASIIVILIVIFLLIIWICLKKYKGLERQARKVLDAYKKKKSRSRI